MIYIGLVKILRNITRLTLCSLLLPLYSPGQVSNLTKDAYIEYCTSVVIPYNRNLDSIRKVWIGNINPDRKTAYIPPDKEIYLAATDVNLFKLTNNIEYLKSAKDILLHFGEYKKLYPPDFYKSRIEYGNSLPALPNTFSARVYINAYIAVKNSTDLDKSEQNIIEKNISESADYLMRIHEWGPMNRAMICAEGLGLAAKAIPDHKHAKDWKKMADIISDDNFNSSHMEDSQKYLLIWLYSLIRYATNVVNNDHLLKSYNISKWFYYLLNLYCPEGLIPDYGDADWGSSKFLCIPIFEQGAKLLQKQELRWAASEILKKWEKQLPGNIHIAMVLSDACLRADFNLKPIPPVLSRSQRRDDETGKKIVFRNGWEENSTYLLLNFRDEDNDAGVFTNYLKNTLAVKEEKAHHGHADENSICLLMKNGSVLLHDGGYRDGIPSGKFGAYRADYFHNKTVVRIINPAELKYIDLKSGLLNIVHDSGTYIQTKTEKIDRLIKKDFEMSKTRSIDFKTAYRYDRVITYLKEPDCFIICDVIKFLKKGDYLSSNLWHTRRVLANGDNWFDSVYDSLRSQPAGNGNTHLLIWFPKEEESTTNYETEKRYYQKEELVSRSKIIHAEAGDYKTFVTVLYPHDKETAPARLSDNISLLKTGDWPQVASLKISINDQVFIVSIRLDQDAQMTNFYSRPKYTWESGRYKTANIETDADFLYFKEDTDSIYYAIAGGTRIVYKGKDLFKQAASTALYGYDGKGQHPSTTKVRYWDGALKKN